VVQLLIQHGADVHDYAVQLASENGHAAVVQLLIQHRAVMPTEFAHDDEDED
jgi:ankyrin repeat protein